MDLEDNLDPSVQQRVHEMKVCWFESQARSRKLYEYLLQPVEGHLCHNDPKPFGQFGFDQNDFRGIFAIISN